MSDAVVVAFVTGGFALVGVLITVIAPRVVRQGRQLDAAVEQLRNSHGTNLRDDLDVIRDEVRAGFTGVTERLHELTTDLAWERRERMDLSHRVDALN